MEERQTIYFAGKSKAEEILYQNDEEVESDKTQLGVDLKREISMLQLEIKEEIKCLFKVVEAAAVTSEALKEAKGMREKLEERLKIESKILADKAGEVLEAAEAKAEKENISKFREENLPKILAVKSKMMTIIPTKPEAERNRGGEERREDKVVKNRVKTAPMAVPKWDGKSRTYPRFKKMWEENIIPFHESSALHMMLVQALPDSILDEISSLASSYQVIWDHLEDKAGRGEVVARDIVGDLMRLDHKKYGRRFLAKFSAILEDSESLLESIGMQDWLTSSRSVSDLEGLLPHSEKVEWAKKVKGATGADRFAKFKTFLKERKEELEALETIGCLGENQGISEDRDNTCTYCKKKGHVEIDCRAKKKDLARGQGGGHAPSSQQPGGGGGHAPSGGGNKAGGGAKGFVPDFKDGCAICGNPEHWKNECPDKNTARNRGRGRGPPFGSVNSNQLRSQDCNRCKFAPNNINNCIGCKKTGNLDHCLLHCGQYLCLGVEDRVKLVRNANTCAICLHAGHQSGACGYRDKSNWVCGISGCRSHHHPTLHGSADAYVKINVIQVEQKRFEDVTDWESRSDFLHDSFVVNEVGGEVVSVERQEELQQARQELLKPGLGAGAACHSRGGHGIWST